MKKLLKSLILSGLMFGLLSCFGCGGTSVSTDTTVDTTTKAVETTDTEKVPDTTKPVTVETTAETTAPETEPSDNQPTYTNPLTGLACDTDISDKRPVSIMINNIQIATPQEGISQADIIYECVVEGWQTRLMMLSMDYEDLPVVGSVRSAREYFLDFAANHDAIFIHAGGSEEAYAEIKQRKVNNLDGVNMYLPDMFYRDEWRHENMGYEHSLMTDGERIETAVENSGYRTEILRSFTSPLHFVEWGEEYLPANAGGELLKVKFSGVHQPEFQYDSDENVYYRWQFQGTQHIDNNGGDQIPLSFTNVIVLYLPSQNTGDEYNHMNVTTTGKGSGYYLYGGRYDEITWSKATKDSPIQLYLSDGSELVINRGKTFFEICTTSMKSTTELQ